MFFSLARLFPDTGDLFRVHPVQLSRWLDEAWAGARRIPPIPGSSGSPFLGSAGIVDALRLPTQPTPSPLLAPSGIDPQGSTPEWDERLGPLNADDPYLPGFVWHHLIYAYLIESTGVFEVFTEVLRRLNVGESLGELSVPSVQWARATEELFFRDPPLFSITGVVSDLRPHARTNRRNAYWRMFGMDLPHPVPPRWSGREALADWKADVGSGLNSDFRQKWTELLRQVWLAVENSANSSGANSADPSYIAMLCRAIKDMLGNRRRGGALAREEFAYVSTLSWFHLTIDSDTPVVVDLKAQASSPADRLAALGHQVGMAPAARSRELFDLAEPMSTILRGIELGLFDDNTSAAALYTPGSPVSTDMISIINNWQSATGERVKEPARAGRPAGVAQPIRIPVPGSPNGAAPVPAGTSPNGARR